MKRIAVILLALSFAACGGGSKTSSESTSTPVEQPAESPESMPAGGMQGQNMMAMCPMHVEGTTMTMENSEEGVVMTFMNPSNMAEVQKRARMMAEHPMSGAQHHAAMPAFSLTAEDTEDGARLMMTPQDPEQMVKMQEMMMQKRAEQGDSPCPMAMMGMSGGKMGMTGEDEE